MSEDKRLEIFYVRHGDTSGAGCGDRSRCDVDLTPLGLEQARLLGERYSGVHFDAILCSPLVRAVRTAAAVAERADGHPPIEIVPAIIENNTMPDYPGVDLEYLKRYYPDFTLCTDRIYGDENGAFANDTDELNDERAAAVVSYIKKRFSYGQKVLVVAHGSFGNHFVAASVGIGEGDYIFSINNTSVTKIKYTPDGKQRISFMNDVTHLRGIMPDFDFTV